MKSIKQSNEIEGREIERTNQQTNKRTCFTNAGKKSAVIYWMNIMWAKRSPPSTRYHMWQCILPPATDGCKGNGLVLSGAGRWGGEGLGGLARPPPRTTYAAVCWGSEDGKVSLFPPHPIPALVRCSTGENSGGSTEYSTYPLYVR